jgi:hypothetical protein
MRRAACSSKNPAIFFIYFAGWNCQVLMSVALACPVATPAMPFAACRLRLK